MFKWNVKKVLFLELNQVKEALINHQVEKAQDRDYVRKCMKEDKPIVLSTSKMSNEDYVHHFWQLKLGEKFVQENDVIMCHMGDCSYRLLYEKNASKEVFIYHLTKNNQTRYYCKDGWGVEFLQIDGSWGEKCHLFSYRQTITDMLPKNTIIIDKDIT